MLRDLYIVFKEVAEALLTAQWPQAYEHARDLYRAVPRNLLRFNVRIAQILLEIQQLMPDVLSLQEVDRPEEFVQCLCQLG